MKFTFEYQGKTCKGNVELIETDGSPDYEITYNNEKAIIFQEEEDITEDLKFLWFQKNNPGDKSWSNDLIQTIGEAVVGLDYYPESFIVAFKLKGVEYSSEVLKKGNGYEIISY